MSKAFIVNVFRDGILGWKLSTDWFCGLVILGLFLVAALSVLNFVDFMRFQIVEEEWRVSREIYIYIYSACILKVMVYIYIKYVN